MEHYAGIAVSLESASLCVVDATGRIIREAKVASEPEVLIAWFNRLEFTMTRIGLEAGPLSQWLYAGMRKAGLAVELLETRHVRDAFKAMPVKTDRKDAHGIAQLMRLGWFRPVHCKSLPAQEVRALLTARKLLQTKNHDVEMSLRGVLRGFGLKVGPTTPRTFASRIRELVAGHATLSTIAEAMLAARDTLFSEWQKLEKRLRSLARDDNRVDEADFDRLTELGFSSLWTTDGPTHGRKYVTLSCYPIQGNKLVVARLIMEAGPREVVRYHDRNPLNLRRSNLYIAGGWAKDREQAMIEELTRDPAEEISAGF